MPRHSDDPRYVAGASCGRGAHSYEDRGSYFKCTVCGSSRSKGTSSSGAAGQTSGHARNSGGQRRRYTDEQYRQFFDNLLRNNTAKREHDYYTLGIKPGATDAEIKTAYRQKAREVHPDTLPLDASPIARKEAEERFKDVNGAYHRLID